MLKSLEINSITAVNLRLKEMRETMQTLSKQDEVKMGRWGRSVRSFGLFIATIIAIIVGLCLGHWLMTVVYSWFSYSPSYMTASPEEPAIDALQSHAKTLLIPVLGFFILLLGVFMMSTPRDAAGVHSTRAEIGQ